MSRYLITIVVLAALGLGVLVVVRRSASKPRPDQVAGNSIHPTAKSKLISKKPNKPLVFRSQDLPFTYIRGDFGKKLPVETTGGGVGMLDYDLDGDLDLFFAQGGDPLGEKGDQASADVLLRNDGEGKFTDVSSQSGLSHKGYGQGVCIADYDGDGDPDVFVTRYLGNTLWRNDGNGKFTDVTSEAGVRGGLWSLGAAFLDYDGDGDLDLFVANYFDFDPAKAPFDHDPKSGEPIYGFPARFDGQPDELYRNEGNGVFRNVTAAAKVAGKGRGMGVLATDLDGDGLIDIYVANDAQANETWRNKGDGTFEEKGLQWGLALNGEGMAEANMGIAYGDTDNDLFPDILVTHFWDEHATLWRSVAHSSPSATFFQDETTEAGLVVETRPLTGWGTAFADFDQDGSLDLIIANGHIRPEVQQKFRYACPPIVFRNSGSGRFVNASSSAGAYFKGLYMGRGLAAGDLDGDGDLDVVIVHHHAPSVVLWNETPSQGHFLMIDLVGEGRNRDAIGARVTVHAGGSTYLRTRDGGGGYLSANDPRLHFGLGATSKIDRVTVRWPSGKVQTRENVPIDRVLKWKQGE